MKWEIRLSNHHRVFGEENGVCFFKKVNMCYFNPSATNHSELVNKRHSKEIKKNKWIPEEPRNSPHTVPGKRILRKQLAYSFSFTKLLDDLALPS